MANLLLAEDDEQLAQLVADLKLILEITNHMDSTKTLLQEVSRRNRLSEEAVSVLLKALESSGYTMAQFSHPELGGMGQWSRGMTMIGDFSNSELKGRVERACSELAEGMNVRDQAANDGAGGPAEAVARDSKPTSAESAQDRLSLSGLFDSTISVNRLENSNWWSENLGAISSSGSQNGCDYAYSRATNRLAIRQDSKVTIYDTGTHQIYGVAQQQGHSSTLEFQSQLGTVTASDFKSIV